MAKTYGADVVLKEARCGNYLGRVLRTDGEPKIDIRQTFKTSTGETAFTQKGIRLSLSEMLGMLKELMGELPKPSPAAPKPVSRVVQPVNLSDIIAETMATVKALPAAPATSPAFLSGNALDAAWARLKGMGINPAESCADCGEGWQYMGPAPEGFAQSFRHRCGYGHGDRRYVNVSDNAPAAPAPAPVKVSKPVTPQIPAAAPSNKHGASTEAPTLADLRRMMREGKPVPLTGPGSLAEAIAREKNVRKVS